jgi:hypothetical protein
MAMVQAQAGMPIEMGLEWHNDRQTLAKKLVFHLHTLQTLGVGSTLEIDGVQTPFVDHGSIKVLARAALENYIVFAFIFGDASSDVCRFRHMTWSLAGLMDRQRRTAITTANQQKLAEERRTVETLRLEIEKHPEIAGLSAKQRKTILSNGDWSAGKKWHELAVTAGLHQRYFQNIYGYFCDYSHSSYAAALQVGEATSFADQNAISSGIFGMLNMMMAHFAVIYAELFATKQTVDRWRFTTTDLDRLYGAAP